MIYLVLLVVVVICCAVAGHASEKEEEAKKSAKKLAAEVARRSEATERQAERQVGELRRLAALETARDAERTDREARDGRRAALARRPEAFVTLFAEEFPAHAGDITYGKAEQILAVFETVSRSDLVVERLAASEGDGEALLVDPMVQRLFARRIAPIVSAGFVQHASSRPDAFLAGVARAVLSSATIAGVDP